MITLVLLLLVKHFRSELLAESMEALNLAGWTVPSNLLAAVKVSSTQLILATQPTVSLGPGSNRHLQWLPTSVTHCPVSC